MTKPRICRTLCAMAVALAAAAGTVRAQIEQPRTFDVASVRLSGGGGGGSVVTDSRLPAPPFVGRGLAAAGITTAVDGTPLNQPSGVSAVKAVEPLGLRLESRRLAIDTIVVDKIERVPSDN